MKAKSTRRKSTRKKRTSRRSKVTLSMRLMSFFEGGKALAGKFTSFLF